MPSPEQAAEQEKYGVHEAEKTATEASRERRLAQEAARLAQAANDEALRFNATSERLVTGLESVGVDTEDVRNLEPAARKLEADWQRKLKEVEGPSDRAGAVGPTETIMSPPPPAEHLTPPKTAKTVPAPAAEQEAWMAEDRAKLGLAPQRRVPETLPMSAADAKRAKRESGPTAETPKNDPLIRIPAETPRKTTDSAREAAVDSGLAASLDEARLEEAGAELRALSERAADMERNLATTREMIENGSLNPEDTFVAEREAKLAEIKKQVQELESRTAAAANASEEAASREQTLDDRRKADLVAEDGKSVIDQADAADRWRNADLFTLLGNLDAPADNRQDALTGLSYEGGNRDQTQSFVDTLLEKAADPEQLERLNAQLVMATADRDPAKRERAEKMRRMLETIRTGGDDLMTETMSSTKERIREINRQKDAPDLSGEEATELEAAEDAALKQLLILDRVQEHYAARMRERRTGDETERNETEKPPDFESEHWSGLQRARAELKGAERRLADLASNATPETRRRLEKELDNRRLGVMQFETLLRLESMDHERKRRNEEVDEPAPKTSTEVNEPESQADAPRVDSLIAGGPLTPEKSEDVGTSGEVSETKNPEPETENLPPELSARLERWRINNRKYTPDLTTLLQSADPSDVRRKAERLWPANLAEELIHLKSGVEIIDSALPYQNDLGARRLELDRQTFLKRAQDIARRLKSDDPLNYAS